MKKLAIIIAILSLLFTSCGGDNSPNIPEYVPSSSETVYITWDQAADYVGRVAQVCGPVMDTSWNELAEDSPTYLNMGKPYPEKGRFPQHEVRQLTFFDGAHVIRDAVCYSGVDGVFGNISSHSEIVVSFAVFVQRSTLNFHFVSRLPRATNDFTDTSHRL